MGRGGGVAGEGGGVNYAEMEAGPEMDACIAIEVMRWEQPPKSPFWYERRGDGYDIAHLGGLAMLANKESDPRWALFQPSTNIAHAWEVLTAIRQRLFSVRNRFSNEVKAQMVTASGERIAWPDALFFLGPEHICRAALMALKPEGE